MNKPALIPELKVSHYLTSLDFYTRLIGFEVLYDRPEEDFAMLGLNGAQLMIEGLTEKTRIWDVGPLEKPFGRGINFQIQVADVAALYTKFKNDGYPFFLEMEEKWYRTKDKETGHRQFLVKDPDGYLLRFYEELGIKL